MQKSAKFCISRLPLLTLHADSKMFDFCKKIISKNLNSKFFWEKGLKRESQNRSVRWIQILTLF